MKYAYQIFLTTTKKGIVVYIPDLDIYSEGKNIADAICMAEDVIGLYGITMEDEQKKIVLPLKKLHEVPKNAQSAFAVVDFEKYRRENDMRTIRKNVTIPSYLNEMATKAHINFSQVLQEALKTALGL